MLLRNFRKNLRKVLKERQIMHTELADRMKVHKSYISNLLNKEYTPGLDAIEKVAKALRVPAWKLLQP